MIEPIRKPTPRVKVPKPLRSKPHVIPSSVRETVLEAAGRVCEWCEVPGGALDCHHVVRRSQGGNDQPNNLRAVHRICHSFIHEHPAEAKGRGFLAPNTIGSAE